MKKIFGIGLAKTGTTSFSKALDLLGYKSIHEPKTWKQIDDNEAITDIAIPFPYNELYKRYPNSIFILTTRDNENWIKSISKQFHKNKRPKDKIERIKKFYGTYEFNPNVWLNRKIAYEKEVKSFFVDKNFIVLDLKDENKWEKLCGLLQIEIPNFEFPHLNKSL